MNDKIRKWTWPLAIIIISCISLYIGFYISTATAFPQNPSTYAYFEEIADMPYVRHSYITSLDEYWQDGGDCDDRAYHFRKYLENKGEKNIYSLSVQRVVNGSIVKPFNDTQGHSFILWNGKVYDAQNSKNKRIYNVNLDEYLANLKSEYGYNTLYLEDDPIASF